MKRQPDRLIRVHLCDTFGRRTDCEWTLPASMVPTIGKHVPHGYLVEPTHRVRRRLWLNPDEVELHCREVFTQAHLDRLIAMVP